MPEILERLADQPIQLAVAVAKVDRAQRLVRGVATQEVLDAHGEVVDYASVKAALATWKGNIREMHQPVAVGKAVAVACDDVGKAVTVEAYISKGAEDTWQKVLDGTLSMYSIGGVGDRVTQKAADGTVEKRLLVKQLHEISLVDVGACPTAAFSLVKVVDGQVVDAQADDAPPAEPAAPETAPELEAAPQAEAPIEMGASFQVSVALQTVALLQELIGAQLYEADEDDEPEEAAAAQAHAEMLRAAAQLVLDFLVIQFEGQFPAHAEQESELAAVAASVRPAFAKVGRRNSKADLARIQTMHDSSVQLGAACGRQDAEKAAPGGPSLTAVVDAEAVAAAVRKLTPPIEVVLPDDLTKTVAPVVTAVTDGNAALSSQLAEVPSLTKAELIVAMREVMPAIVDEALQKRLEPVLASPRPGGPVKQAVPVDKTLGGVPPASGPPPDLVSQVVSTLAAELAPALGPTERATLAQKVIALTQAAGGRPVVPR